MKLKYSPDFTNFSYTSPQAVKGGKVTLHDLGSFDKLNPFTVKGMAPFGMEMLVYDPLAVESLDEPFALYGLLAKDIALAKDGKSVVFTLDSRARFSDGRQVTAADVAYTLKMLQGKQVHPYYNYYYRDIEGCEILDKQKVRFIFSKVNRELPLIAAQIRIMPEHGGKANGFEDGGLHDIPIGSGPYRVKKVVPGKIIIYERNKQYWAIDHPARRNMYNFDEIAVKYFKDQTVALEAFKAGEFDFISINIAKQWARDMSGPLFTQKKIIKREFPHSNSAGMQGFAMNTRRLLFQDVRVRKALGLALNFDWINRSLFHNQYTRSNSFFSNSPLAAKGIPQGDELQLLLKFKDKLPKEVFTRQLTPPDTSDQLHMRRNLLEARDLLEDAGWKVQDGILKNAQGKPFRFEILLGSRTFERVMASYVKNLKRLGIVASYRTTDSALYMEKVRSFDFDMIVASYGQSQSPGNEQKNYWSSAAADRPGSRNYPGIHSPVVDDLTERIVYASDRSQLVTTCRALDRVLWYGYYLVPNWYLPYHRIGFHNKFGMPEQLPLYYSADQLLMTWWLIDQ